MKIEDSIRTKAESLLESAESTMIYALGIRFLSLTKDELQASMPVSTQTVQPVRILHGGASVALAETLMSIGAWLNLEEEDATVVGIEINANHVRRVPEGKIVTCIAKPLHIGRQIQVWESRITDEDGKLVSVSRCTLAVINPGSD